VVVLVELVQLLRLRVQLELQIAERAAAVVEAMVILELVLLAAQVDLE
jgi:hypothetical protein